MRFVAPIAICITKSIAVLVFSAFFTCLWAERFYVSKNGSDVKSGLSWADSFLTLGAALQAAGASASQESPCEIWIAEGVYAESAPVAMLNNTDICGGFAGNETSLAQRISGHDTILSGGKSHAIFENAGLNSTASLSFVILRDGYSDVGGAMRNVACSLRVEHCVFIGNYARKGGAVANLAGSALTIADCRFVDNSSEDGGAIYISASNPQVSGCVFSNNFANQGGAISFASVQPVAGVRWKLISSDNELADYESSVCERLDMAQDLRVLSASENSAGYSDFDHVYPWSAMKVCAIKTNDDGSRTKIYDGEAGFARDGSAGDVFIEIPKHYIKREIKDGYEYRWVSAEPSDGFYLDPSFIENGRQLDYIYISVYEASADAQGGLASVSKALPAIEKTRQQFRQMAQKKGDDFGLFDIRSLMTIQNLFLIEMAQKNSQKTVGGGWGLIPQPYNLFRSELNEASTNRFVTKDKDYLYRMFVGQTIIINAWNSHSSIYYGRKITSIIINKPSAGLYTITFDGPPVSITTDYSLGGAPMFTGLTDSVKRHTGKSKNIAISGTLDGAQIADYYNSVKYRGIENLWGNVWHMIDGLNTNQGKSYVCMNMKDYKESIDSTYSYCGFAQDLQSVLGGGGGAANEIHYTKNLGYSESFPWLALPANFLFKGVSSSAMGLSSMLRNNNFGDYYYLNAIEATPVKSGFYVQGGGFDHFWRGGLFTMRGWCDSNTSWYLYGARLIYKPVN